MSKELVIAAGRHETKVAILEDDQLVEVYFQRSNEYSLAGSIHKGRVTRVLPGMQSAFVDLGLERDTFLYVSDFFEENEDIDTVTEDRGPRRERSQEGRRDRNERNDRPAARPAIETPVVVREEEAPAEGVTADEVEPVTSEAPTPMNGVPPVVEGGGARQPDNSDRNRRGRRSRRRRSRGHGFPENKYAQPTSVTAEPVEALEAESEEAEPAESTPIILPGESLAKYRHASLATPELEEEPEDADDVAISQEEAEAIEERSDELETADRILSHHVDESTTIAEEEKIEDVRNDQPVSPFVVGDIETEEEPLHSEAEIRDPTPIEALYVPSDELEEEGEPSAAADQAVSEAEGVSAAELAEDEVAARRGTLIGEAVEVTRFDAVDLDDVAAAEEAVAALEAENGGESPEDASEESRTASVREQGGRSMHRVSRRMRRRRGGNRFGQQQQQFGPGPREETPQFQAAGSGTAPAVVPVQPEARREGETRDKPERVLPSITDLLKPGQELIVQIAKEPLGQKGARITSHVALPGRYVVFMPSVNHLGVSRKVESEEERQRLKRILQAHRVGTTGGFIVRTAGEGVPEEEIAADMDFLYKLWLDIRQKAEKKPAPILLHCDLDVVQRILRDQVTEDYKAIWVDSEDMYENVLSFVQRFQPNLVTRVKMYTREAPIFDAFNITQELEKALRPKVWLKSGGYIVINQTEALVAIDINTGKYVGKSNRLEDTIVKTNTEAVKEIVRQIRLRDLGGIIVVDFIDMDERKNRQKVMQALEEAMQADKAPYKILQFNDFGLVAITRKRVKQSLERTLCAPCPYCEGAGYVKSVQTIVGEILVEAVKIRKALDRNDVLLRVHPDVARVLKASDNRYLEELEETLSRPVLVKGDPALHHEKFDLG